MAQPQPQQPPHLQMQMPMGLPMPMSQIPQMQQQQMSPQLTPRPPFSPAQNSPSPVNAQHNYAIPPHKRPIQSPGPQGPPSQPNSQPASPYLPTSSYAPPATAAHSPTNYTPTLPTPQLHNPQLHTAQVHSPQLHTPQVHSPQLHTPQAHTQQLHTPQAHTQQLHTPQAHTQQLHTPQVHAQQLHTPQYTTATMAPIAAPPPPLPNAGVMGPPSKPAEKPVKEYEYDISDSLAGTGVDLRAEEQALAEYYAGSFMPDSRSGLPNNAAGAKGSMYGAGWANQPGQPMDGKTQEQYAAEMAKRAWDEAAQRLAILRSNEIREPFLQVSTLHYKADKIAKEYGLSLNLDMKTANSMGKMKLPHDFQDRPTIKVGTKACPDGAVVMTTGSWIPQDAYLVDQLALLSIATKHRLRELLEDASMIATTRQTTSHGEVPEEWADVAVPLKYGVDTHDTPESAVSPHTNPLKRSFDAANAEPAFSGKLAQNNTLTKAIRDRGSADRQVEEARLKKRQKRLNPETAVTSARAGSAAPGTPGGAAPESEGKGQSKKEAKKNALVAKAAEAYSTANANQTLNTLMGGFGGRKKGKTYSWLSKGGGSGASTPGRMTSQADATAAASPGGGKQSDKPAALTADGRSRLGTFREDTEKGKNIQLRDWVVVLEMDGKDCKSLQDAYLKLDTSTPK